MIPDQHQPHAASACPLGACGLRRASACCAFRTTSQVGRTKIITLHSGIWLENQIDM